MNKIVVNLLLLLVSNPVCAQHRLLVLIKDEGTGEPLVGATAYIERLNTGATADARGLLQLNDIPPGKYEVMFRYIGYIEKELEVTFPVGTADTLTMLLKPKAEELEEVTVTSTRSNRTIANIPTRVETITAEELDEKTSTRPSDIREMLNESSGVLTQQTSAATSNASIRIQ